MNNDLEQISKSNSPRVIRRKKKNSPIWVICGILMGALSAVVVAYFIVGLVKPEVLKSLGLNPPFADNLPETTVAQSDDSKGDKGEQSDSKSDSTATNPQDTSSNSTAMKSNSKPDSAPRIGNQRRQQPESRQPGNSNKDDSTAKNSSDSSPTRPNPDKNKNESIKTTNFSKSKPDNKLAELEAKRKADSESLTSEKINLAIQQFRNASQSDLEKATTELDRAALVAKWLKRIDDFQLKPEEKYAIASEAFDLSLTTPRFETTVEVIQLLNGQFDIDIQPFLQKALTEFEQLEVERERQPELVRHIQIFLREAARAGANKTVNIAADALRKQASSNRSLNVMIANYIEYWSKYCEFCKTGLEAIEELNSKGDEQDNVEAEQEAAGMYEWCEQKNRKLGLELLADSGGAFSEVAKLDLAMAQLNANTKEAADLALQWKKLANKENKSRPWLSFVFLERAAYWLEIANEDGLSLSAMEQPLFLEAKSDFYHLVQPLDFPDDLFKGTSTIAFSDGSVMSNARFTVEPNALVTATFSIRGIDFNVNAPWKEIDEKLTFEFLLSHDGRSERVTARLKILMAV
ncbi:MAG: hypothetical protein R3C03_11065 [Pirellulaceae bacterium]